MLLFLEEIFWVLNDKAATAKKHVFDLIIQLKTDYMKSISLQEKSSANLTKIHLILEDQEN